MTPARQPASAVLRTPIVVRARRVLTAPAVSQAGALAGVTGTAARISASRASAESVFRAVARVLCPLSVARTTAPITFAVIPASPGVARLVADQA